MATGGGIWVAAGAQADLGLGKLYEFGLGGKTVNLDEAARLYRIALKSTDENNRREAQERLAAIGR